MKETDHMRQYHIVSAVCPRDCPTLKDQLTQMEKIRNTFSHLSSVLSSHSFYFICQSFEISICKISAFVHECKLFCGACSIENMLWNVSPETISWLLWVIQGLCCKEFLIETT